MPVRSLLLSVVLITSSILILPLTGYTETLVIPDISNQPSNTPEGVPRPTRSMTMEQVKEQFGNPLEIHGPVGDPPITRWVYKRFVVHFEQEYVIHSVVRKNP